MYTPLKWATIGAAATFVIAAPPASAQDTTTTTSTSTTTSTTATRLPTSATPQMIEEAIQRSLARSDKLRTLGKPELNSGAARNRSSSIPIGDSGVKHKGRRVWQTPFGRVVRVGVR